MLERAGNVEYRLRPGADHCHRKPPQCGQVGRHVVRVAPVDATDATRGKHPDSDSVGGEHRGCDRGGTGDPGGQHPANVPQADLGDLVRTAEPVDLVGVQPDTDRAVQKGHGRRYRPAITHGRLDGVRGLDVAG